MAMLGQILHVPWNLEISGIGEDQAPVPLRLFSNVMTLHWHNMNVTKMSTLTDTAEISSH